MLQSPFFTKSHPSSPNNAPRSRWAAWLWKRHKSKTMKNNFLRPCYYTICTFLVQSQYEPFRHYLLQAESCNIHWKIFFLFLTCESRVTFLHVRNALVTSLRKEFPAFVENHDFESGTKVKSWKVCSLGPPVRLVCTLFEQLFALRKLPNKFGK